MTPATGTMHPAAAPYSAAVDAADYYSNMLAALRDHFGAAPATEPLFTTDVDGAALWIAYLDALPAAERQHHNCHACRQFVERFGGMVWIRGDRLVPATWGDGAGIYAAAFNAARRLVARARVTGVFLSSLTTWGIPSTRDAKRGAPWRHMHVVPSSKQVYRGNALKNADQAAAEKLEEYGMLQRGLAEFSHETMVQALAIADSEALYRGEKVAGHLRWLVDLSDARRAAGKDTRMRESVTWLAIATAPAGFAHVRSSMVGTLLEDLEAGLPLETVKRKFGEKMNPLKYQRPTAAPSDGAIAQAEKIVEALNTAGALRRRYATLDDVQSIWTPAPPRPESTGGGVFGHLKQPQRPARVASKVIKAPPITFEKFRRTVLGDAASIEAFVPTEGAFIALVTAADAAAPPILQWDREDRRNPVSWYVYPSGSLARQWGLVPSRWTKVNAVTLLPFMWNDGASDVGNHGAGAIFVVDGCKDSGHAGSALFPETLKSEYHGVRSVIERYSRGAQLEGREAASACGLDLRKGGKSIAVRVTSKAGAVTEYTIDRWD